MRVRERLHPMRVMRGAASSRLALCMSEQTNSLPPIVLSEFFWIKLCDHSSMIVREAKLKHGTAEQYSAIDEAIRTAMSIASKRKVI
jgi:hypothetical protein